MIQANTLSASRQYVNNMRSQVINNPYPNSNSLGSVAPVNGQVSRGRPPQQADSVQFSEQGLNALQAKNNNQPSAVNASNATYANSLVSGSSGSNTANAMSPIDRLQSQGLISQNQKDAMIRAYESSKAQGRAFNRQGSVSEGEQGSNSANNLSKKNDLQRQLETQNANSAVNSNNVIRNSVYNNAISQYMSMMRQ